MSGRHLSKHEVRDLLYALLRKVQDENASMGSLAYFGDELVVASKAGERYVIEVKEVRV